MAFTVEDGTQVVAANTYVTLAAYKAYMDDRGIVYTPTYSDAQLQVQLINGCDFMDRKWRDRYVGSRLGGDDEQGRLWPREDAVDRDGVEIEETEIPTALKVAQMEYAIASQSVGDLAPNPSYDDSGAFVIAKRERVGPIEEETKFSERVGLTLNRSYPKADGAIKSLLTSNAGRTIRA